MCEGTEFTQITSPVLGLTADLSNSKGSQRVRFLLFDYVVPTLKDDEGRTSRSETVLEYLVGKTLPRPPVLYPDLNRLTQDRTTRRNVVCTFVPRVTLVGENVNLFKSSLPSSCHCIPNKHISKKTGPLRRSFIVINLLFPRVLNGTQS